jgi:hypothetical protein
MHFVSASAGPPMPTGSRKSALPIGSDPQVQSLQGNAAVAKNRPVSCLAQRPHRARAPSSAKESTNDQRVSRPRHGGLSAAIRRLHDVFPHCSAGIRSTKRHNRGKGKPSVLSIETGEKYGLSVSQGARTTRLKHEDNAGEVSNKSKSSIHEELVKKSGPILSFQKCLDNAFDS